MFHSMTIMSEIKPGELADLVPKVLAGDEALFTQGQRPVAKLVSAFEKVSPLPTFNICSLKGHRVLTLNIFQEELADDIFNRP